MLLLRGQLYETSPEYAVRGRRLVSSRRGQSFYVSPGRGRSLYVLNSQLITIKSAAIVDFLIFPFYFILPWQERTSPSRRETDIRSGEMGTRLALEFAPKVEC